MPLNNMGISTWIASLSGEEIPQYAVKPRGGRSMECWIPALEGCHFKLMWKVSNAPRPDLDLFVYPYLDGTRMCGCSWSKSQVSDGGVGELGHHPTGPSSFRLYKFGKRQVTDEEDTFQSGRPRALINELNTIKIRFAWGHQEAVAERAESFVDPIEVAPIHETEAKHLQGLSGSAWLSQEKTTSNYSYSACDFRPEDGMKSITFIFRYAPRDWLQAQNIIARTPQIAVPSIPRIVQKRSRSITPAPTRTGTLETKGDDDGDDDGEIVFMRHMIRTKITPRKKRRRVESPTS